MEPKKPAVSAVVFDLDGTLLDTLADIGNAFNAVLKKRGFPEHALEAYRQFVGEGPRVLTERALPETRRDPETVEACLKDYLDLHRHPPRKTQTARPYPGIPELLDGLSRRSVPMAVVSNKVHEAADRHVKALLGGWRFSAVFGFRENVPKKPDPFMALAAAQRMGVRPGCTAFVGDTGVDMKTAAAAEMIPVGALWGFRTEEELIGHGASILLDHPGQLLGYISNPGR